jgi:ligand-binding SRPBCC domain-containing protein
MKRFSTSTLIHALPETIWEILVDGTCWSQLTKMPIVVALDFGRECVKQVASR